MTRTVRIGPVPPPPGPVAPRGRRRPGSLVGAALLVAAAVCWAGYALLAGAGTHSFDRHATPPATVDLLAGATYFLSTHDGPGAVPAAQPLACTYVTTGGTGYSGTTGSAGGTGGTATSPATAALGLTVLSVDSRATHAVASFVAPVSGEVTLSCSGGTVGGRAVFVDDAEDAAPDVAGWLLLLGIAAALAGAGLVTGALAARTGATRVSGVTSVPAP